MALAIRGTYARPACGLALEARLVSHDPLPAPGHLLLGQEVMKPSGNYLPVDQGLCP